MSPKEYEYSDLEGSIIKVKKLLKKKGEEYGIFSILKSQVKILAETISLMTASPEINLKFSEKIEEYLSPRFNEIMGIISMNKELPEEIGIELSKENQKNLLKGFEFTSVLAKLMEKKINYQEIYTNIKKMKMFKYQKN